MMTRIQNDTNDSKNDCGDDMRLQKYVRAEPAGLRRRARFRLRNKDRFQILDSESGESELGSSDP
ncbi:hypothetical protein YC2023_050326 [Brassica napus]